MMMAEDQIDNETSGGFGELTERETTDEQDSTVESTESEPVVTEEESSEETQEETTEGNEGEAEGEETKEELTEKGTKLDPNPLSRAHQELANERKVRTQMETVLASPELISKFVKQQYGIDLPIDGKPTTVNKSEEVEVEPEKEYKAEDFENLEDVANVVNQLNRASREEKANLVKEIETLKTQVNSINSKGRLEQIANTTETGISTLRKAPELDPNSPDFIEGLEEDIAQEYHRLDFDNKTGNYFGKHSIADIGERIISIARKARKAGSLKAQTIVKDKTAGKIKNSTKVTEDVDNDEMSPANSIAKGVANLFN